MKIDDLLDDSIVKKYGTMTNQEAAGNEKADEKVDEAEPMELDEDDAQTNTIIEVNNLADGLTINNFSTSTAATNSTIKNTDDELLVKKARMQLDFLKKMSLKMEKEQELLLKKQQFKE